MRWIDRFGRLGAPFLKLLRRKLDFGLRGLFLHLLDAVLHALLIRTPVELGNWHA